MATVVALRQPPDPAETAEHAFADYLAADRVKPLLRFVTCGSVDDGKSTLIGRLLYDTKQLFQDQLAALESDSRRFGTQGDGLDFALLVDGLSAEREQGITIDVAYRFFSSERRKFIVADAPGHEQYTRNMATAASTADLAIILIDATQGVLPQTRRHSHIVRLMGVKTIVLAVNKMDRVGHDRARFERIVADYAAFAAEAGVANFTPIPLVAIEGDNVTRRSAALNWYNGPTLIEALENAPVGATTNDGGFALPVQWVNRPDSGFRGFAGTIARGAVAVGDPVTVLPGGATSRVARIVTFDGDLPRATAGQAVTIVLDDQVECAAGAVIAARADPPATGQTIDADLVWLDTIPLVIGRRYLLLTGARQVPARVERVDVLPGFGAADGELGANDIGRVRLVADGTIAALPYGDSRALGGFVLIDRATHATVAAGMIRALTDSGDAARPQVAPVYAFPDAGAAADALVARLRGSGTPAQLLDRKMLLSGIAAGLDPDGPAFWQRAVAAATLLAGAGVTVALAVEPPAGAEPFGTTWSDGTEPGNWVI